MRWIPVVEFSILFRGLPLFTDTPPLAIDVPMGAMSGPNSTPSRNVSSPPRSSFKRVLFIPNVGFYSLPKIMGRTGRFIYDGLRLISLGCKQKQKNTNIVQKPNTALVAVGHFPLSPYRLPVGSSANKSLHWG